MYGSAGTGKTLILCEALKIKLSKFVSQGRRIRILATGFDDKLTTELLNCFSTKYLVNVKNIEVIGLEKLCRDLNIEYYKNTPRDTMNRVIASLSNKYRDIVSILLVDEVLPSERHQITPDWRELEVRENVIWILGLSPGAPDATSSKVLPPVNSSVVTRQLIHKYRNCPQIRN